MTTDPDALARRAVACRAWRWLPGMRCTHRWTGGIRVLVDENGEQSESYVVLPDEDGNAVMTIDECGIMGGFPDAGSAYPFLPDFTDAATLGCLLALVREAHGAGSVVYLPRDGAIRAWRVVTYAHGADWLTPARCLGEGATEAEALVVALESTP